MKLYLIQLTCDHDLIVLAEGPDEAFAMAEKFSAEHGVRALAEDPMKAEVLDLSGMPRIVAVDDALVGSRW
jgi:hypothetical protein